MKLYSLIVGLKEVCVGDWVETNRPFTKIADICFEISPTDLVLEFKNEKNILPSTRLVRLISMQTKEKMSAIFA